MFVDNINKKEDPPPPQQKKPQSSILRALNNHLVWLVGWLVGWILQQIFVLFLLSVVYSC